MNTQFGPLNWAEVMSLHLNAFEAKIYAFGVIFTCFCCFYNIAELQGWISAQQWLKSKNFRGDESFKMIQRINLWTLETFSRRFGMGRNDFLSALKCQKWTFSKKYFLNFGPIRPKKDYFGPCILDLKTSLKMLPDNILQHITISYSFEHN